MRLATSYGLLLLLLSASCWMPVMLCCSDVMLSNTSRIDAIVSGRHLDWFPLASMALDMVTVPTGSRVVYLPDLGCSSSAQQAASLQSYTTAKYGYVGYTTGLAASQAALQALCTTSPLIQTWIGIVFDGMNSEGLSAAILTQRDAPAPGILPQQQQQQQQDTAPATSALPNKVPMIYTDILPLILTNFKSVADVMENVTPARFFLGKSDTWVEIENQIMGHRPAPVVHVILHDAQGDTAVLEFIEAADGSTTFHILPNPDGVTTNAPKLEDQLQFVREFRAKNEETYPGALTLPGHCTGPGINAPTAPWCDSVFRFSTLHILKEVTYGHFPHPEFPLNPHQGRDPSHTAYTAVMALLNRVTVPGAWPAALSNTYAPDESTVFQMIRDHRKRTIFARHYGNMQWFAFDVLQLLAAAETDNTLKESDLITGSEQNVPATAGAARTVFSEAHAESRENTAVNYAQVSGASISTGSSFAQPVTAGGAGGIRIASVEMVMPVHQPWAVDGSSTFLSVSKLTC